MAAFAADRLHLRSDARRQVEAVRPLRSVLRERADGPEPPLVRRRDRRLHRRQRQPATPSAGWLRSELRRRPHGGHDRHRARHAPRAVPGPRRSRCSAAVSSTCRRACRVSTRDEFVARCRVRPHSDFKVGANYIHRTLPVVIEDISIDGGNTYLITNPGVNFDDEAAGSTAQATQLMASSDPQDQALAQVLLEPRATACTPSKNFDKPRPQLRRAPAHATQRPTKASLLIASYTYSRSMGNYPGLFSTETGQLDPNITSLYDLPGPDGEPLWPQRPRPPAQRQARRLLPFDLKKAGQLRSVPASARSRASPHNVLGAHLASTARRVVPAAARRVPRGPVHHEHATSSRSTATRSTRTRRSRLRPTCSTCSTRRTSRRSTRTTRSRHANPIIGGQPTDLGHLKTIDPGTGLENNKTATPNKNFDHLNSRAGARNMQLGFRLTF